MAEKSEKRAYGAVDVNLDSREVFLDGEEVQLTAKEFYLLEIFVLNPGKTFTRDELLNRIWGDEFTGHAKVVDIHLSQLRKKLSGSTPFQLIRTIRGIGYKSDFPRQPLQPMLKPSPPLQITNNLPIQLSGFIGRETEIGEIKRLLKGNRLVTLTGAGGIGKTRLALKVAEDMLGVFPDGVWLVSFVSLEGATSVAQSVAEVFQFPEEMKQSPEESLIGRLKSKNLLILLDNCEHVAAASAELVKEMLSQCPLLWFFTTSRERLGLPGEVTWRVQPLSVPDPRRLSHPAEIVEHDAVRLFVSCGKAASPRFELTEQNAATVARICRILDGIPLAIELAAAKLRVMSAQEALALLENASDILKAGSNDSRQRHQQTLRGTIDWSYQQLPDLEKRLLHRLSVFAGGFNLEAVEATCEWNGIGEHDALELLVKIVEKSLVSMEESADVTTRYRLLEPIRQFAFEKLEASGEGGQMRQCHFQYFLKILEMARIKLDGPEQTNWLKRIETELENIRVALDRSCGEEIGIDEGLGMATALGRFWEMRGHLSEGREYLSRILSRPGGKAPTPVQVNALLWNGYLHFLHGDLSKAVNILRQALSISQALGEKSYAADTLMLLGEIQQHRGENSEAESLLRECLTLQREMGSKGGIAAALNSLGLILSVQGKHEEAATSLGECLDLVRESEDRFRIAKTINNSGLAAWFRGDVKAACLCFEESLTLFRSVNDTAQIASVLSNLGIAQTDARKYELAFDSLEEGLSLSRKLQQRELIAWNLAGLARLAAETGEQRRACILLGAVETIRGTAGIVFPVPLQADCQKKKEALKRTCGEKLFREYWEAGEKLSLEEAIHFGLSSSAD